MQLATSLKFSDVFDGPEPKLADLLENIPSDFSITLLSIINAQIYLDQSMQRQLRLIGIILNRQPKEVKDGITNKIAGVLAKQGQPSIGIFSQRCSFEFAHYELTHYRSLPQRNIPEDELKFFQAYLLFAEDVNSSKTDVSENNTEVSDPFQSKLWPVMIGQFTSAKALNPITELPKSIALLNYFEFQSPHGQYVTSFLKRHERASSWNYLLDMIMLISTSWESSQEDPQKLYPFIITLSPSSQSMLSHFILDVEEYKIKHTKKRSFTGLKEKPFFKIKEDKLAVLSWNLVAGKVYEGLVFDIFFNSGIDKSGTFKDLIAYKTLISTEVIEKFLFRKLVESCFPPKKNNVRFDDSSIKGFPDAYVRKGKYIFLFEIKDSLFPVDVIDAPSEQAIKEQVDKKYNNESKGTGQIIKQLLHLKNGSYESSTFEQLKLKRRNLIVYPIIVYTDRHFGLPGINRYLVSEFKKKVADAGLDQTYQKIKPVTFINISFLSDNIDLLKSPDTSFQSVLDVYHSAIKSAEDKFKKRASVENSFALQETLETVFERKFANKIDSKDRDYVNCIVEAFGLIDHLPKGD